MFIDVEGRKLPKTKKRTKVVEATTKETETESRQRRSFSISFQFILLNLVCLQESETLKLEFQ